eukprot:TRINITY_DN8063_c0_g1_i1.p1 TRINITY_DN8063_c0_g1~~TRINITY_DN8063_c0_g1_i1.p1  ORF type:complete len:510 (+),score=123.34 TRINITY_DN8063_c0_g1_i1:84-1532(+)
MDSADGLKLYLPGDVLKRADGSPSQAQHACVYQPSSRDVSKALLVEEERVRRAAGRRSPPATSRSGSPTRKWFSPAVLQTGASDYEKAGAVRLQHLGKHKIMARRSQMRSLRQLLLPRPLARRNVCGSWRRLPVHDALADRCKPCAPLLYGAQVSDEDLNMSVDSTEVAFFPPPPPPRGETRSALRGRSVEEIQDASSPSLALSPLVSPPHRPATTHLPRRRRRPKVRSEDADTDSRDSFESVADMLPSADPVSLQEELPYAIQGSAVVQRSQKRAHTAAGGPRPVARLPELTPQLNAFAAAQKQCGAGMGHYGAIAGARLWMMYRQGTLAAKEKAAAAGSLRPPKRQHVDKRQSDAAVSEGALIRRASSLYIVDPQTLVPRGEAVVLDKLQRGFGLLRDMYRRRLRARASEAQGLCAEREERLYFAVVRVALCGSRFAMLRDMYRARHRIRLRRAQVRAEAQAEWEAETDHEVWEPPTAVE